MINGQPRPKVFVTIVVYSLCLRLLPYVLKDLGVGITPHTTSYPWNFSPVWVVCLFGGACLARRWIALLAPLAIYLVSDAGIGLLMGRLDMALYPGQSIVYASLVACTLLGFPLRGRRSVPGIAGAGFVGCTLFFLTTNFGWWWLSDNFDKTWQGLVECYVAGLPHYRNSLVSTAIFGAILFSPLGLRQERSAIEPVQPAANAV